VGLDCRVFGYVTVRLLIALILSALLPQTGFAAASSDVDLERLLRKQVFNQAFDGFDHYYVTIENDQPQADGSREVTVVASGKFLQNTKRMKVLFLIVGDQVIGGQVLEGTGLPPCLAPGESGSSAL
jgi:hypothetical protein